MLISRKPTTLHCWTVLKLSYKATWGHTIGLRSVGLPPGALTYRSPTQSLGEQECSQTMIRRDWSQGTMLILTLLSDQDVWACLQEVRRPCLQLCPCGSTTIPILWLMRHSAGLLDASRPTASTKVCGPVTWGMTPPDSLGRLCWRKDKGQKGYSKVHMGTGLLLGL